MRKFYLLFLTAALAIASNASGISLTLPKMKKSEFNAPNIQQNDQVFIEANSMDYDNTNKITIARGKVEILKGENVLFADMVTYDQGKNLVTADGNVVMTGPEGNTVFSNHMVLKDDFSEGVVKYFRARLSDGSIIAANRAERIDENTLLLHKGVYSPCPVCAEAPDPQWQIKANTITVDNAAQKVSYKDATFDLYGIPIMYTPYFSHPTPNADSKSGFITPNFRNDSNLGIAATVPYYVAIKPNFDVTLEPVFTTKEGAVAAAEMRSMSEYGYTRLFGSYTRPTDPTDISGEKSPDSRGHIEGTGEYDLSDDWDIGFNGKYASDDTYLRRYNYGGEDLLTQRLYSERINGNDYTEIQALHFQGLLEQDIQKDTPTALPYIRNHFESHPGILPGFSGSTIWADASGFAIQRDRGEDNQRASLKTGATVPFVTDNGQLIEIEGSLRGDQYDLQNSDLGNSQNRLIPEASITWHLPLVDQVSKTAKVQLEPIAKLVISPNKNYNKNIPNEDSQDVEFSDLNVFDNDRYRGLDEIETGTRVYYGLRGGYFENNYNVDYLVGQNYRFEQARGTLPLNSGIEDQFSDYVGRVTATIYDKLDVSYKFRLDKDKLALRRSEVDATVNVKPVKLSVTYFALDYDYTDPSKNREEVQTLAQYDVTDEWAVMIGGDRNLEENKNIDAALGLLYSGDCSNVLVSVKRNFLSDRDARSSTSVNLQLGLKNIGGI